MDAAPQVPLKCYELSSKEIQIYWILLPGHLQRDVHMTEKWPCWSSAGYILKIKTVEIGAHFLCATFFMFNKEEE